MDELLEALGLKYEKLTLEERETYHNWYTKLESTKLTLENVKEYVVHMKDHVAAELSETSQLDKEKNITLKARLRNYILLAAFLDRPEKAREALFKQVLSGTQKAVK